MQVSDRHETKEQKKARVAQHRQEILRRIQKQPKQQLVHKQTLFIDKIQFDNTLPDIPSEPKLLRFPHASDQTAAYNEIKGSAAEAVRPRELLTDPALPLPLTRLSEEASDVAVPVGLFLGGRKAQDMAPKQASAVEAHKSQLHELDRLITSERFASEASRAGHARPELPSTDWVRHSTVFHNNMFDSVYKHADPAMVQQRSLKSKMREMEAEAKSASAGSDGKQLSTEKLIDAGFAAAEAWDKLAAEGRLGEVAHPEAAKARRGVVAVGVSTLLPDAARWEEEPLAAMLDSDVEHLAASLAGAAVRGGSGSPELMLRRAPSWVGGKRPGEEGLPMQLLMRLRGESARGGEAWAVAQRVVGTVLRFGAEEHIMVAVPPALAPALDETARARARGGGGRSSEAPAPAPPAQPPAAGDPASAAPAAAPPGEGVCRWAPVQSSLRVIKAKPVAQGGAAAGAAGAGSVVDVRRAGLTAEEADRRRAGTLSLWARDVDAARLRLQEERAERLMGEARQAAARLRAMRGAAAAATSSSSSSSSSSGGGGRDGGGGSGGVGGGSDGSHEGGADAAGDSDAEARGGRLAVGESVDEAEATLLGEQRRREAIAAGARAMAPASRAGGSGASRAGGGALFADDDDDDEDDV